MTPLRPYLATLTLTTLATIWAGSAIVQRERRIEVLKTAAARSGDKQLSAREAGNSEDVLMTLTEKPAGSEERLRPTTPIDQRREGLTASVSYDQSGTRIAAIKRGRQSSDLRAGSSTGKSGGLLNPRLEVRILPGTPRLRKLALGAAKLCGVPPDLFLALIARESSWNPGALSRAGAVGLTQTMPATARGLDPTLNLWDPWENLLAGGCTLRQYYDRFGTWPAALHSYHGGPTRVREGRVLPESRRYAQSIVEGI